MPAAHDDGDNPLLDSSAEGWARLVQRLGPAAMLLCIEQRMGPRLREVLTPEDIWQETLLHLWRDRAAYEWRGYPTLRRYVLAVAENRIRNAADRQSTQMRGAVPEVPLVDTVASHGGSGAQPPPATSTTPSQAAALGEEVAAMRAAVAALPADLREVLHLRLFEELTVAEVAARLQLGESAVKHRFRRAAAAYEAHLRGRLRGDP